MIQIKNVSKTFTSKKRKVKAIDDISISLPSKGLVFIIGESGAGKTTFTKLISLIEKVDKGEILYNGFDIAKLKGKKALAFRRKHIGIIFQENNLIEDLTVKENIKLACDITNNKIDDDFYSKYSDILPSSLLEEKVENLSGGQKQRVAILRGISSFQDILICDEPTMSLDEYNSQLVFDLLIQEAKNRLVIVVTHNKSYISNLNYRIVEISNGKIVSDSNKEVEEKVEEYKQEKVKYNNLSIKNSLFLALKIVKNNLIKFSFTILALFLSLGCLFTGVSSKNVNMYNLNKNLSNSFNLEYINIAKENYVEGIDIKTINNIQKRYENSFPYTYVSDLSSLYRDEYNVNSRQFSSFIYDRYELFFKICEYNYTSINNSSFKIIGKTNLIGNEIAINYDQALKANLIFDNLTKEENYNILQTLLNKDELKTVKFKHNNIENEYKIVSVFDTNYDTSYFKQNFPNDENMNIQMNRAINDFNIFEIENSAFFSKEAYENFKLTYNVIDRGIFVSTKDRSVFKSDFYSYMKNANLYYYTRIDFTTFINLFEVICYLLYGLFIVFLIISILLILDMVNKSLLNNINLMNILLSIGISRFDLTKIFILNQILLPLITTILSFITYLIYVFCLNDFLTDSIVNFKILNINYICPILSFILITFLMMLVNNMYINKLVNNKKLL